MDSSIFLLSLWYLIGAVSIYGYMRLDNPRMRPGVGRHLLLVLFAIVFSFAGLLALIPYGAVWSAKRDAARP